MVAINQMPSIWIPVHHYVGLSGTGLHSFPAFLLLGAEEQEQRISSRLGPNIDQSPAPVRSEPSVSAFAGLVPWAKRPRTAPGKRDRRKALNTRPVGQQPRRPQESEACHA